MGLFSKKKKPPQAMLANAEIYLNYLEYMFGEANVIRRMKAPTGPAVHVFYYRDLPEDGMLTAFTYGLSEGDHPHWRNGKCELVVSLNTCDEGWGMAAAFFAAQFRGQKSFSYGSLFTLDEPITPESEMCGYFTFVPSFITPPHNMLVMPEYKIFLTGLYPVHPLEIEAFHTLGLEKFWHHPNFDMYNVRRPPVILA